MNQEQNPKTGLLFGLVNFEEPGMPWTRVFGKYRLIREDNDAAWGGVPMWEIELENGKTCFVPQSSVQVIPYEGCQSDVLPPQKTAREQELEDLLRSACAIAEREGRGTHWGRFIASINKLGLNGITARTYRILPGENE